MEHSKHDVNLLDVHGQIIGKKPRYQINKPEDIYHTIHVMLITLEGELVLSTIPIREDLPNMYATKLGTTAATIRRSNETALEGAQRAVSRELFIDTIPLTLLGEGMFSLPNNHLSFMSVFYGIAEPPANFSGLDIESLAVMSTQQFRQLLQADPDRIAPSLVAIWDRYHDTMPL